MSRGVPILMAVVAVVSCSDPIGVAEADGVRVEMISDGLHVHNRTSSDLHYYAIDQNAAAYTEWVGCGAVPVQNPAVECQPGIPPGDRATVASTEITGWGTSRGVIVYWWHLVPAAGGGWQQGSLRSLNVSR